MAKVIKNNLGFLGEDFQYRLIKTFMEEPSFFRELYPIIDQNMFTNTNLKIYVGVLKEYFAKNDAIPSYSLMEIKLREKAYSEIEIENYDATVNKVRHTTTEGIDEIRELSEKFFKQQNLIRVANEILKVAGDGDIDKYDDCVKLIEDAQNVGQEEDLGISPLDDLESVLSKDYRITIPTGIKRIDDELEGGLAVGELGIIIGPSSFGKALSVNELVVTPNGYVRNGDLKVGDYVIGKNGRPTKILGVYPQGKRNIYRVTFSDGVSCLCDMEHLWNVIPCYQDNSSKWNTMTLKEIVEEGILTDEKKYKFKVPICDPVQFNEIPVTVDPYLIGTIIGDNKNRAQIEQPVINKLKHYYHVEFEPYPCVRLFPIKGMIHHDYLFNSLKNRIKLFNGLMDSSSIRKENGIYCYISKSKELAKDVKTLVLSLGGFANINYLNDRYEVEVKLDDSKITKYGYQDKGERFIKSVEFECNEDAQCIKVDADDELYLTNDFIVTHNTSLTTAMASYAATYKCEANDNKGFKVLQIVFEDRLKQIQRKHIGRLTQIEAKDLSKPDYIETVKHTLDSSPDRDLIKNNVRIKRFPSGEKTPTDIKNFIKKLRNSGFSPSLVIIDYFECLKLEGERSDSEWTKEGKTMRKIETMADEFGVAIWCPTQGTKDSLGAELVTMDKAGGSIKKIQIGHIIMSIARSMENIKENKANISILKNRAGSAGLVINGVNFNNGTCTISTDDIIEFDDALAYHEYEKKVKADNILNTSKEIFNEINKK